MAFDSKDTAAFKGVWVFCEQREGVIMSTSYQLLSEGRKLANDLGVELCGVVLGKDIKEDYLKALGGYGADKVYYCNHELLDVYTTDAYTKVICDLVEDKKPEIFLIGATNIGRDLGPRCAARLHTGLTADCTHLDVDVEKYKAFLKTTSTIDVDNTKFEENTNLKMTRPAFGGHLMATIICPRFRPQMSTVRPGVMQTQPYDEAGAAKTEIVNVDVKLDKSDIHVDVLEVKKAAKKLVDLIGADVVVSVGRGISKDVEGGIKLAEERRRGLLPRLCRRGLDLRRPPGGPDRQDSAPPHLCGPGHLRRHPAPGWHAGLRVHHRGEQERVRPHLRRGFLRHRGRPLQGHPHAHRGHPRRQGREVRGTLRHQYSGGPPRRASAFYHSGGGVP